MNDRSNDLENYSELKFSREQSFFDKSLLIRFLIAATFIFCLFLFLHFREVKVEIPELNSLAPRYIVSQQDFDFFDEEATIILKQDAIRDIGKIYRISEKEIHAQRSEFENYIIYNHSWRDQLKNSTFEEMYTGIELLTKFLNQVRFTDPRTLQHIREIDIPEKDYLVYTPEAIGSAVTFPSSIWNAIEELALPSESFQQASRTFIIDFFKGKKWTLEQDIPSERNLRRKIQARVPDKFTHVSSGNRILDQGERVTTRHIAMLQAMKKAMNESRNLRYPLTIAGSLLLAFLMTAVAISFFRVNYPKVLTSNRRLFLLTMIVLLTLGFSKSVEELLLNASSQWMEFFRYPLFIPFAAILTCNLMNPGIATFVCGFLMVVMTMALAFDFQGFMITNLSAALIAILSTRSLRKRKDVFVVCGKAWAGCLVALVAMHFYEGSLSHLSIITDILSSAVFMFLTGVLVVGILPLLESAFQVMTDVTLMEYSDPNHPLLRRLTLEAPGTYQHSVAIGSLAEGAAIAIDANGLFARVASLYHDVGKIATAQYFTENQQGDVNIHQLLTPLESAQAIMAHVSEGVAMARKAGLPEQFIDIMKEHHGTTLVYYFYRKELELKNNDKSQVNEQDFRYSGPKPRSKESAIIMIADSFEAASRSLEKIDEATALELINRLIREKAEDGQFDECLLTFEELDIVKKTMVKVLVAAGHTRVKYPARPTETKKNLDFEVASSG